MADFTIKKGDTSPAIKYQLQDDDGNPVNITDYNEVKVGMWPQDGDTLKVDADTSGNVSVTDAANGEVKYEWQSADTDTKGRFHAEWEVTYSDGTVETFPNQGYIDVFIPTDYV